MTVERVSMPAIRYVDEQGRACHMIPLHDPGDGTWWVLDETGTSFYRGPDEIREFARELADDGIEPAVAYEALADVVEELERPGGGVVSAPDRIAAQMAQVRDELADAQRDGHADDSPIVVSLEGRHFGLGLALSILNEKCRTV